MAVEHSHAADADVVDELDQAQPVADEDEPDDPGHLADTDLLVEADEADVLEQHVGVPPAGDEDYPGVAEVDETPDLANGDG